MKVAQERLSRVFHLKEYSAFKNKYGLMCIPSNPMKLQAIISMSRFPSEIKKDQIYIGNLTNVMSHDFMQLKMLGIKSVVCFTPDKFESLEKDFNVIHYEVKHFSKELETLPL